jgi:hypothetical protein
MAGYAASVAISIRGLPGQAAECPGRFCGGRGTSRVGLALARWFWTAGCAMLWLHMASAFQFQHGWSHAAAYAHTAGKTEEFIGLRSGAGLYFNYVLLAVWTADAAWWWTAQNSYRSRPAALGAIVRGFIAFMAINATVVFGSGLLRWLALAATLALVFWAIRRRTQPRGDST